MTAPPRDRAVARWLRRPLWWLLGFPLLAFFNFGQPLIDLATEARIQRVGTAVPGSISGSWDGGQRVPVSFTPPGGGDPVSALAWGPVDTDRAIGPVELQVDPGDPSQVRLAGPLVSDDAVEVLILMACIEAALALWWWSCRRTVRRGEQLAGSDQPSYRMVGVPTPGRFARGRWRLQLYPLDVPPGTEPVCTVPVIGRGDATTSRIVEVKGEPRAGGFVVAVDRQDDRIWWPSGRVLTRGRAPLPAPDRPSASLEPRRYRWLLLALGVALVVYSQAAAFRSALLVEDAPTVRATVLDGHGDRVEETTVRYWVDGTAYESSLDLAGPQRAGNGVEIAYDPGDPRMIWQDGTAEPVGSSLPGAALAFFLGLALIALGVVFGQPAVAPRAAGGRGGGLMALR